MPDLTLTDIARLEAAADKATPGPYRKALPDADGLYCLRASRDIAWVERRGGAQDARDVEYLAQLDPATVKALCSAWRGRESLKATGPRIPSPELLAKVEALIRRAALPGLSNEFLLAASRKDGEAKLALDARALLSELSPGVQEEARP